MRHLTSVRDQPKTDSFANELVSVAKMTQEAPSASTTLSPVLRQEATSADYGIILILALVVVYCWVRIGKK